MVKYDPDKFFGRKNRTQADRLRAMSDEELTNFFCKIRLDVLQTLFNIVAMKPKINKDELAQEWKKWFEEEVDHSPIK